MSLRALNKRIQHCSREMERQRRCTKQLLLQQRSDFREHVPSIPLPALIGLALISGFLAQRLFHTPAPSFLFRLFLTWRAL